MKEIRTWSQEQDWRKPEGKEYFSGRGAINSQNCGAINGFEENNKPSEMTLILRHNRRAGTAVQFHDKVGPLFYSSHILGFLVKEEL